MIVQAIHCSKCNDIIYSRARHDFHSCMCGSISIDGGRDYTKIAWNSGEVDYPKDFSLILHGITQEMLYQDWNKGIDNYGWQRA